MNPTRTSLWDDPSFIQHTAVWGDFYKVSRRLVGELGQVLVTPTGKTLDIATRWTQALLDAYRGVDDVQSALEKAAQDIDQMAGI